MKLDTLVKEYLIEIEVRKYTPKTIRGYRVGLNLFLRFCKDQLDVNEIDDVTLGTVRQFTKFMTDAGRKGTYINGLLKTLKSFLQYCYEEGYGGFNTKRNFKWCKEERPVITAFSPSDVRQMLQNCKGYDFISIRDKAVLTLLFETGIRCWELCCIQKEDIHDDFIVIKGKNHKQRVVPITPILQKAFLRYEAAAENYFTLKSTDNYYFLSFHGRQLTNSAVEHIVKRHGRGIEGVRVSPHTCRHFFAQQQIKLGTDLYTISRLLGHENIRITQTYLNSLRDDEVIQIAKQKSVLMNL
ncbi:tyrosine-type recombinase/integrase [Pseudoflavonifractor phocaeensis]|nr:tyrosine-type recombinase/integrase [Pseudoflavonifractor phocaeensis]MCF2675675.1 tyrosine-type recombinase/integrase [Pseudoflavonifractor phocaeensis]